MCSLLLTYEIYRNPLLLTIRRTIHISNRVKEHMKQILESALPFSIAATIRWRSYPVQKPAKRWKQRR